MAVRARKAEAHLAATPDSTLVKPKQCANAQEQQCIGSASVSKPVASINNDLDRERHDVFNLVALVFVNVSAFLNWDLSKLNEGPELAWTDEYFYHCWVTTMVYFLADLTWVARVPTSVKSPGVIIKHHIVAIAYLGAPVVFPKYRWFMGACLTVEINTWFLIMRRVVYKRRDQVPPFAQEIVSQCFYASWIGVRMYIYPGIMYIFCRLAYEEVVKTGIWFHWPMLFMPVHFILCVLNLKWSYDLFQPMFARKFTADNGEKAVVSSGL